MHQADAASPILMYRLSTIPGLCPPSCNPPCEATLQLSRFSYRSCADSARISFTPIPHAPPSPQKHKHAQELLQPFAIIKQHPTQVRVPASTALLFNLIKRSPEFEKLRLLANAKDDVTIRCGPTYQPKGTTIPARTFTISGLLADKVGQSQPDQYL